MRKQLASIVLAASATSAPPLWKNRSAEETILPPPTPKWSARDDICGRISYIPLFPSFRDPFVRLNL